MVPTVGTNASQEAKAIPHPRNFNGPADCSLISVFGPPSSDADKHFVYDRHETEIGPGSNPTPEIRQETEIVSLRSLSRAGTSSPHMLAPFLEDARAGSCSRRWTLEKVHGAASVHDGTSPVRNHPRPSRLTDPRRADYSIDQRPRP